MATTVGMSNKSRNRPRGSSPHISTRRPKLSRSSATEPSLATSNACRNDLASLQTNLRAAALLNRVASYSRPQDRSMSSTPSSEQHTPSGLLQEFQGGGDGEKEAAGTLEGATQGGSYFSFPDFDDFPEEPSRQELDIKDKR